MKKRFVLVLALVLMVASVAFAADVKFSGWGKFGYNFYFAQDHMGEADAYKRTSKGAEGRVKFTLGDADGLWLLTVKEDNYAGKKSFSADYGIGMQAYVSLSKALKKFSNVDTGDFSFGYGIGDSTSNDVLSVYQNYTGNDYDDTYAGNGGQMMYIDGAYGKLVQFKFAASPEKTSTASHTAFAASAIITPVDGIGFAVGYANNGSNDYISSNGVVYENLLDGMVNVDIAKLAGLDFKLSLSAMDTFMPKTDSYDAQNILLAQLAGGTDTISAYMEYVMYNDGSSTNHDLYIEADFNLVKNLSLDAYFQDPDLGADNFMFDIGGDVGYTMGSVKYNLNMQYNNKYNSKYKNNNGDSVGCFSLTPSVKVSF